MASGSDNTDTVQPYNNERMKTACAQMFFLLILLVVHTWEETMRKSKKKVLMVKARTVATLKRAGWGC